MTHDGAVTLTGIGLSAGGTLVGAAGVLLQMNGYYAFEPGEFFPHLWRTLFTLLRKGPSQARARVAATVAIGARKGENRVLTMLGLYLVMAGFLLQTVGSLLVAWALFL